VLNPPPPYKKTLTTLFLTQKTKTKAKTFIGKIPLPTSQAKDSAME